MVKQPSHSDMLELIAKRDHYLDAQAYIEEQEHADFLHRYSAAVAPMIAGEEFEKRARRRARNLKTL